MKTKTIAASVLLALSGANAADLVWIGGTGNWTAAGNWSPSQVPTAVDNAWITNSGTYTVTIPAGASATVGALTLGGASGAQLLAIDRATLTLNGAGVVTRNGELTFLVAQSVLTGPGNLTVDGTLTWSDGTISGSGALTISSSGVFAIGSGGVTLGRSLNNNGAGSWSGGNLTISAGNAFNNVLGGTFDITADGKLSGAATTPINNFGLLRLTAGSTDTTITAPFNNSGTVVVLASTLNLNLGGTHSGTFNVASGANLGLGGGSHVLSSGSFVTGAGAISISGGATTLSASGTFDAGTTLNITAGLATLSAGCNVAGSSLNLSGAGGVLNFNSTGPAAAVNISGGVLGGNAPVTVTGLLALNGGSITNTLVLAEGGVAIGGNTTLNGAKLVNPGTAVWSAGNITGANGAVISNLVGAVFINTFDGNAANAAGATPLFVNEGSFQKTNGTAALGTTSIDFQFLNTGTVEVRTNTFRYNVNSQTAGLTLLDGGDLSAQGQPIQLLGGELRGSGTVTVGNTLALVNSSLLSPGLPVGELDISGNYQQTGSGALNIELGGYSPGTDYDLITVTGGGAGGVANLGGTLNVNLMNGFSPTNGAGFTFLTAASRVGSFTTFNYPSNDIGMQVSYDGTSAKVSVSNLKPVVAVPITAPPSITYGSTFNFQFAANTFNDPDGDLLTYTAFEMPPGVVFTPSTRTFSGTPTSAGTFPVALVATDNGVPSLRVTNVFNIDINPAVLIVAADARTKTYGEADPQLTFTAIGLQFSDTEASALTGTLGRVAGESIAGGPYAITQGNLAAANANYTISFTGSTLSITPATLNISAQPKTKVFGVADPLLSFTVSGFQFNDTQASALTGALSRAPGESVAGSPYTITQGSLAAANDNYAISFTGSALGITPATLNVSAQPKTKVYGATDPVLSFTVSGFQFNDTQASALTGALARAPGESVAGGPYTITQGSLTAANGNYTISFAGSSLSITPATLSVTAQPQTKVYGAADPSLSFTVAGLQLSDTQASALAGALTRATGESVAGSPYAITHGSLADANGNYTISFSASSLSISPATLSITAQPQTKIYGAADPVLSFTVSGLQFTDTQASALSGALTRNAGESVAGGPYAITQGSLAVTNGNYAPNFTGSQLSISPAPLSVIADPKTKVQGAPDPAFTAIFAGFVNSETSAVLGGALALTRSPGENPDNYSITASGLTSSNYAITFVPGTLTIEAAPTQPSLTIAASSGTGVLLTWAAIANVTYRVQHSSDLNGTNWVNLAGDVVANSNTASKIDALTATNRFYRVRVVP